jgi:hypothetical protein
MARLFVSWRAVTPASNRRKEHLDLQLVREALDDAAAVRSSASRARPALDSLKSTLLAEQDARRKAEDERRVMNNRLFEERDKRQAAETTLFAVQKERDEALADSKRRTDLLNEALDRAERAEAALAAALEREGQLRKALKRVDNFLTVVQDDAIPRGEACKLQVREIARAALADDAGERE